MTPQPRQQKPRQNYHRRRELEKKRRQKLLIRRQLIRCAMVAPALVLLVVAAMLIVRLVLPKTSQTSESSSVTTFSEVSADPAFIENIEESEETVEWSEARTIIDMAEPLEAGELIDVPIMDQEGYPTGCETISTIMLLRYYGIYMSADEFINNYLPMADYEFIGDYMYGPDPNEYFVGDPRYSYSFGCFAPVIEEALSACIPLDCKVEDLTGIELSQLAEDFISQSQPLLIWASMDMAPIYEGQAWILPSGETFIWPANEHCLVMIGYDDEYYYFNDPLPGEVCAYEKELVEERYEEMGMQALALVANDG